MRSVFLDGGALVEIPEFTEAFRQHTSMFRDFDKKVRKHYGDLCRQADS